MKNRVAFALFRDIPNFTGLKTRYINLWINGVDYGLFTHTEAYRKEYLVNRKWNKNDNLYNVENFYFKNYSELRVDSDGKPINKDQFEKILEIKNGNDHRKLIEMLEAVNSNQDIDKVIEKYFNRKNYLTWIAVNMVLNNKDILYHNYVLFNPKGSDKFYFLPWDYDGAWAKKEYLAKWEYGFGELWIAPLHRKFLSKKKNRDDLDAMIQNLRQNYITDAKVQALVDKFSPYVEQFIQQYPDNQYNSLSSFNDAKNYLVSSLQSNIDLFNSQKGHPMPFSIYVSYSNQTLKVWWDESVDFEGDKIVYDINVSSDINATSNQLTNVLISKTNFDGLSFSQNINLSDGTYYIRIVSKELNNPSHYQIAFDGLYDVSPNMFGVKRFNILNGKSN